MEYHYVIDPVPDGDQFFRLDGIFVLYRLRCPFVDDRLFLCRSDFPFRRILSIGIDALVLEVIAFPYTGSTGHFGLCQIKLDGSLDGWDTYGVCDAVDSVRGIFYTGMFGIQV